MAAEDLRDIFGTNLFPSRCSQPTRLRFSPRPRHLPVLFRLTPVAETGNNGMARPRRGLAPPCRENGRPRIIVPMSRCLSAEDRSVGVQPSTAAGADGHSVPPIPEGEFW